MVRKNDILEALGLQEATFTQWLVPALIGFGMGSLVGAGIALLFAPKPGAELRGDILERGRQVVNRGRERIESATQPRTDS